MSNWPTLNDLIVGGMPSGHTSVGASFRLPDFDIGTVGGSSTPEPVPSTFQGSTLDWLQPSHERAGSGQTDGGEHIGNDAPPPGFLDELPPSLVSALARESGAAAYEETDPPAPAVLGDPDFEDGPLSFVGEPIDDDLGVDDDQYEPALPELSFA